MSTPTDTRSVILAGARTPIGKYRGALSSLTAADLGAVAIAGALERAHLPADSVGYVIMGQVITAGAGQNPARIAAAGAGVPLSVPATTVNKVCLSGLDAIVLADQLVRSGDYDIVIAGGMESMSQAPHLVSNSLGYGDVIVHDSVERDGLWDHFTDQSMGQLTERVNTEQQGPTRSQQDTYAAESHQRAAQAWKDGTFDDEVVPVSIPQRRGEPVLVTHDEGVRPDTTVATLSRLRPSFDAAGTITAGSSSPLSDGAAAVVVTSKATAERLGLSWIAEIGAHATVGGPDSALQGQPARAVETACAKAGIAPGSLDLTEINEAFAAIGISSTEQLGLNPETVNIDGGAIALGHPLGMSGARIALHLALALHKRGGGVGAAALCGGGGQGEALLLHVPAPVNAAA
jgi:acetyl-CoA C-acetyltransferase